VLKVLRSSGQRPGRDVALGAFQDPDRLGGVLDPPLTTLVPQERELGAQAAALLLRGLARPDGVLPRTELRLPARMVVRRSCGCGGAA
jgi:LacI family transcriptional regulator